MNFFHKPLVYASATNCINPLQVELIEKISEILREFKEEIRNKTTISHVNFSSKTILITFSFEGQF